MDKKTVSMVVGDSETLKASVEPGNADNKNSEFSSSDVSIATVTPKAGKVTAIKEGSVDIVVTTEDGNKKDICKVTVTPKVGG